LRLLNEGNDRASKTSAMHRQAYNAIATAAAFVAEAKKRNVDVSRVVEMLVAAKKAFERLDYERALQLASVARAETDKVMVLYSSAQKIVSSRGRLELAAKLGIDAPHLREVFGDAKEAMKAKDYEKALALAQRTEDEFTTVIQEKLRLSLSSSELILDSVEGVNMTQANDAIVRARAHLAAGEFDQAADLTIKLRDQLDLLKRQRDEAGTALRRLKEIVADADGMSVSMPTTSGWLEKADRAYKMGQFDEALDDAAQAEAEATKERDREIASVMQGFEESLMRARIEGTDTRSAERLFERARDFVRAKKYRQAIATAQQSEAEADRIGLQQMMARQAVETV
jgi:tetratricopeptide (TPR) repeat protein